MKHAPFILYMIACTIMMFAPLVHDAEDMLMHAAIFVICCAIYLKLDEAI